MHLAKSFMTYFLKKSRLPLDFFWPLEFWSGYRFAIMQLNNIHQLKSSCCLSDW